MFVSGIKALGHDGITYFLLTPAADEALQEAGAPDKSYKESARHNRSHLRRVGHRRAAAEEQHAAKRVDKAAEGDAPGLIDGG